MSFNNSNDTTFAVDDKLKYYFQMVTISTGIFGNIISFIIFTRPHLIRRNNTGFLYAILSVLNVLTILEYDFYLYSNYLSFLFKKMMDPCYVEVFVRACLNDSLVWMQVLVSFDRFILIIFPRKAQILAKRVRYSYFNDFLKFNNKN